MWRAKSAHQKTRTTRLGPGKRVFVADSAIPRAKAEESPQAGALGIPRRSRRSLGVTDEDAFP